MIKKIKKVKSVEPIKPIIEPVKPVIEKVELVVEPIVAEPQQESAAKVAFRNLIENYKKVSPKKYEMKKVALENKLNAMK